LAHKIGPTDVVFLVCDHAVAVHKYIGECNTTSLCVQRLPFVPPWFNIQTHRHTASDELIGL